MFCCSSRKEKKSSGGEPVELVQQVPRSIRPVRRLQEFDYTITRLGEFENPAGVGPLQIDFYAVWYTGPLPPPDEEIAILGGIKENGQLIISEIFTTRDPRPEQQRPRAADILLGFWCHELEIPVEDLKGLFFDNVEETTMGENQEMRNSGTQVKRFDFIPKVHTDGAEYSFKVTFE
ncbi:hypothetical protein J7T55_001447 [Diaporthe amygdali]|uniref:uncharacterized protein n=1 Tax=Phomopsis amygdali TaxID=1214568 RepID=UPI0022FE15F8|nr:uncharacterized protein J7T55_001447 [Diaporthe amygdali]KAJ0115039.1 hypothetical protein J7T55_001447 [Diaporthe amygdali]